MGNAVKARIMLGDCLDKMKEISDNSVDMVLCDLPYGVTQNKWDKVIPFDKLWEQYDRICKINSAIVLFCQQPFTTNVISSNIKNFKYCWTWYKHHCSGFLNAKKQPLRNTEEIAVFYKSQCKYNPQMVEGKYRGKGGSSKQRGNYGEYKTVSYKNNTYYPTTLLDFASVPVPKLQHPTEKPVPLLEYLIKTYTDEHDCVLDNCMGSGSTGVACMNTAREFIGIEIDGSYFETAKNRIAEAGGEILL